MQIVHIANWLAHTLCKGFIWNYKKLLSTALTFIWDPASTSMKLRMYQVSFFLPIQDFVLKFWNLHYFHLLERCIFFFFNTLRPRQNGHHFADDSFKCIFMNEEICNLIQNSLKFVPSIPIDNKSALVQIMAWRQWWPSLLMHICVTRLQWVKELFRLLNCLHIFADFVLLLALVDDTPWWEMSIK